MKIYNPFKKIKELNEKITYLEKNNSALMIKIKSMEEKNKKHECGDWCNGCKNLTEKEEKTIVGTIKCKFCMLDNPCKDRVAENE